MKSMGLIVLLPFLSVIILSLHAAGGASRWLRWPCLPLA